MFFNMRINMLIDEAETNLKLFQAFSLFSFSFIWECATGLSELFCIAAAALTTGCHHLDDLREEAHCLLQISGRWPHFFREWHGRQTVRQTTDRFSQGIGFLSAYTTHAITSHGKYSNNVSFIDLSHVINTDDFVQLFEMVLVFIHSFIHVYSHKHLCMQCE